MNEHFEQDAKKFKKVEEHVSAAFLGGQNSYSHLAAISFFGSVGIELKSSPSISGLFQLVSNNETDFSVVPSESAASGSIAGVIDHLLLSSSKGIEIMAEKRVVEKNALSAWPGVTEQEIGRVFGHAHHLSGCETYLLLLDRRRQSLGLPAIERVVCADSSTAAKKVASEGAVNGSDAAAATRVKLQLKALDCECCFLTSDQIFLLRPDTSSSEKRARLERTKKCVYSDNSDSNSNSTASERASP